MMKPRLPDLHLATCLPSYENSVGPEQMLRLYMDLYVLCQAGPILDLILLKVYWVSLFAFSLSADFF